MNRPTIEAAASIGRAIAELENAARCLKQADVDAEILDALGVTTCAATLLNRLMRRPAPNGRAPQRTGKDRISGHAEA